MTPENEPTTQRKLHEPIVGAVAKILTARELVINRGREHGVKVGMKFQVLDPKGEDISDPETDETLGSIDRPKVSVEITAVEEKLSVARTFHSRKVNVGGIYGGLSGLARQFEPPRYETRYDTLKTDESTWEDLDESESFVKTGDPVREIVGAKPGETHEI
jgi:hypothetical protein